MILRVDGQQSVTRFWHCPLNAVLLSQVKQRDLMTTSYQTQTTDTSYNGWTNYETWNVALWIGNDEGLYNMARRCYSYQDFLNRYADDSETPDGVKFNDVNVNHVEMDEMFEEM